MSALSLVCEISGESLSLIPASDAIVVTPSGHICRRSLLLTKLAENGGVDPFFIVSNTNTGNSNSNGSSKPALCEEDLVELHQQPSSSSSSSKSLSSTSSSVVVVPPRLPHSGSGLSSTLRQVQHDYDAVLLELFDTRQALAETRRELSVALYQNDAAVRVVARVAAERDQALSNMNMTATTGITPTLSEATSTTPSTATTTKTTTANSNRERDAIGDEDTGPTNKKPKLNATSDAAVDSSNHAARINDDDDTTKSIIPPQDWQSMNAAWEKLQSGRKARQKAAAKRAVTATQLQSFGSEVYSFHNNTSPSKSKKKRKSASSLSSLPSSSALVWSAAADVLVLSAGEGAPTTTNPPAVLVQVNRHCASQLVVYRPPDEPGTSMKSWTVSSVDAAPTTRSRTIAAGAAAVEGSTLDVLGTMAAIGCVNGTLTMVNMRDMNENDTSASMIASVPTTNDNPTAAAARLVDVRQHPDGEHIVCATSQGDVLLIRSGSSSGSSKDAAGVVARFTRSADDSETMLSYNAGALHPDGLIYVAADSVTGHLFLWDFKQQSLWGSPLIPPFDSTVSAVECSNNGYHIAAAYQNGTILVWDLRKRTILATLNTCTNDATNKDGAEAAAVVVETIVSVKFDDSGKYLAYSGNGRLNDSTANAADAAEKYLVVCVVTIKEWDRITAVFHEPTLLASPGLAWGETWIAASAAKLTSNNDDSEVPHVVVMGLA